MALTSLKRLEEGASRLRFPFRRSAIAHERLPLTVWEASHAVDGVEMVTRPMSDERLGEGMASKKVLHLTLPSLFLRPHSFAPRGALILLLDVAERPP